MFGPGCFLLSFVCLTIGMPIVVVVRLFFKTFEMFFNGVVGDQASFSFRSFFI